MLNLQLNVIWNSSGNLHRWKFVRSTFWIPKASKGHSLLHYLNCLRHREHKILNLKANSCGFWCTAFCKVKKTNCALKAPLMPGFKNWLEYQVAETHQQNRVNSYDDKELHFCEFCVKNIRWQWRSQYKFFWGEKCLQLGEQQYCCLGSDFSMHKMTTFAKYSRSTARWSPTLPRLC